MKQNEAIKAKKLKVKTKRLNRSKAGDVGIDIALILLAAFMVLPMVYVIGNSFKSFDELFVFPPRFIPLNPTPSNYLDLFTVLSTSWVPISRYLFNTVFVTVVGGVAHIFISSLAAYALCKFKFPGREALFQMVVLSLMFSATVTQIPSFLIIAKLGLLDTSWSLILPAISSSLGLYLMKQFMEQLIHDSLLEAARIDGAGEIRIFGQIVMPLVKPAWLTLMILTIQSLWNATGSGYIFSEEIKMLPTALSQITATGIARAGVSAAITVIMMLVPIMTFVFSQSQMIETMATSGMKD